MYGMKFAALYTLQDRLTRNIKQVGSFEHRHVAVGNILDEARTQFIV